MQLCNAEEAAGIAKDAANRWLGEALEFDTLKLFTYHSPMSLECRYACTLHAARQPVDIVACASFGMDAFGMDALQPGSRLQHSIFSVESFSALCKIAVHHADNVECLHDWCKKRFEGMGEQLNGFFKEVSCLLLNERLCSSINAEITYSCISCVG